MNRTYPPIPREVINLRLNSSLLAERAGFDDPAIKAEYAAEKEAFLHRIVFLAEENGHTININEVYQILTTQEKGVEIVWDMIGEKPLIPLNLLVSFAETLIAERAQDQAELGVFFNSGTVQKYLRDKLRFDNEVAPRDLTFTIENQTSDSYRSIIELTSNAIDFSPNDDIVMVETSDNGFSVRDYGTGMSMSDLMFKLPVPNISGERAIGKSSIGKFGLGFYTTLMHLQNDNDYVEVRTSTNGTTGQLIRFLYLKGQIYVQYEHQTEILQGTEVRVFAKDFDRSKVETNLQSFLRYKRGATILLNQKVVNDLDRYQTIESQDGSALLFNPDSIDTTTYPSVKVLVNGVLIEEIELEGNNLFADVSIDFPYSTTLPESRDFIPYSHDIRDALSNIIDSIIHSTLTLNDKIALFNALAEIIVALEERVGASDSRESLTIKIRSYLNQFEEECVMVPNDPKFNALNYPNQISVSGLIYNFNINNLGNATLIETFVGRQHTAYLVDFKEGNRTPIFIHDKYILIDRVAWETQSGDVELFENYLNLEANGNIGTFRLNTESNVSWLRKEKLFPSDYKTTARRLLDEIISKTTLDSYHFTNLVRAIYNSQGEDVSRLTYNTRISQSYLEGILSFLKGSISLEQLLSLSENELEIFRKVLNSNEWNEFLRLTKLLVDSFISPVGTTILDLPRDEWLPRMKEILMELKESSNAMRDSKWIEMLKDIHTMADLRTFVKDSNSVKLFEDDIEQMILSEYFSKFCQILANISDFEVLLADTNDIQGELLSSAMRINSTYNFPEWYLSNISLWKDVLSNTDQVLMEWYFTHFIEVLEYPTTSSAEFSEIALFIRNPLNFFLAQFDSLYQAWHSYVTPEANEYIFFREDTTHLSEYLMSHLFSDLFFYIVNKKDIFGPAIEAAMMRLWRLRSGNLISIKYSFEEIEESWRELRTLILAFLENKRAEVISVLPALNQNIHSVMNLPSVNAFLTLNADIRDHLFGLKDNFSYKEMYMIFNAETVYADPAGYLSLLSLEKLKIIESVILENFLSRRSSESQVEQFHIYLKRVIRYGSLSDEQFQKIQPLLLTPFAEKVKDSLNQSVKIDDTPHSLFQYVVIERISRSNIPADRLSDFAYFWTTIYNPESKIIAQIPIVERLNRLILIWESIAKLPGYQYDTIFSLFSSNITTPHISYKSGLFNLDSDLTKVSDLVRPYIIYYLKGESEVLSSLNTEINLEPSKYRHSLRLSDLTLARKLRDRGFFEKATDPETFSAWVNQLTADKENLLSQRAIIHAIYHQSIADPFIFLRELIQNSVDAIEENGDGNNNEMIISEVSEDGNYVIEIKDFVGMTFETVMGYLLTPEFSTKTAEQRGKFGIGFMNIFRDAERVSLRTNNNGLTTYLDIDPVMVGDEIVDLKISYEVVSEEDFRGTEIRKYIRREHGALQSAFLENAVMKYGGYVDLSKVSIVFNGYVINQEGNIISTRGNEESGFFTVRVSGDPVMTQGGVYVNKIPEEMYRGMPGPLVTAIRNRGVNLELDRRIPLTRSRNNIARKDIFIPLVQRSFIPMAFDYFLSQFANGTIEYRYLPYDYIWESARYYSGTDPSIIEDAERINRGEFLEDYSQYMDEERFFLLLTQLKCISINDTKYSLHDLAQAFDRGTLFDIIDEDDIPYLLNKILSRAREFKTSIHEQEDLFDHSNLRQINDFRLEGGIGDLLVQQGGDTYLAFMEICKIVGDLPLLKQFPRYYTLYQLPDRSVAHANRVKVGWNIGSKVVEDLILNLSGIISKGNVEDTSVSEFIKLFSEVLTHELAHTYDGSSHASTHNSRFYNVQKQLIASLIYEMPRIREIIERVITKYRGTYIAPREVGEIYLNFDA